LINEFSELPAEGPDFVQLPEHPSISQNAYLTVNNPNYEQQVSGIKKIIKSSNGFLKRGQQTATAKKASKT
jgi:hypothetical protein